MFSTWIYVAVAFAIAAAAFLIGQLVPDLGVPFVVLATTLWAAFAANRGRRLGPRA